MRVDELFKNTVDDMTLLDLIEGGEILVSSDLYLSELALASMSDAIAVIIYCAMNCGSRNGNYAEAVQEQIYQYYAGLLGNARFSGEFIAEYMLKTRYKQRLTSYEQSVYEALKTIPEIRI